MENQLYDVFLLGVRTLYILGAPLILVIFVAGSLASILQSALSVQEATMNYAVRLIALVVLLYLLLPTAVDSLVELAQASFR